VVKYPPPRGENWLAAHPMQSSAASQAAREPSSTCVIAGAPGLFAGESSLSVLKPAYSSLYIYCQSAVGPLLKVAHVGEANTDVEYVLVDVMVVVVVDVTVAVTLELMVTWLVAVDVFVKEVVFVLVAVFDTVFRTAVTVACGTPAQEQALTYLAVLLQDSKVRLSRPVGLATSKGK
jgi:hypothetical protein